MTDAVQIDILMYHSISDGPGPTCISPAVFRRQLDEVASCGIDVIDLRDVAAWRRGERVLERRSLAITFDDGFRDFADLAFPELRQRGWPATVFIPTQSVGANADWDGLRDTPASRPTMDWSAIGEVVRDGASVGAHGLTHRDLTQLTAADARREVSESRRVIEQRVDTTVTCFAFPYGRSCSAARAAAEQTYELAVGTRFDHTAVDSDIFELPRIEMSYFRRARHWRNFLHKQSTSYFRVRQALRLLRSRLPHA